MSASTITEPSVPPAILLRRPEQASTRLLVAYIVSGLLFLLLPGTFLGVWNLIAISEQNISSIITQQWIQAHGHAQIFGWIGSFILGIGFYSLPRMRGVHLSSTATGWAAWILWTSGVWLRWVANVYGWHWRLGLPVSAALEATAFLLFLRCTMKHHGVSAEGPSTQSRPVWITAVLSGTVGLFLMIVLNLVGTFETTQTLTAAFPPAFDSTFLIVSVFGFIVPTIWGFSARWIPVFLGLRPVRARWLQSAILLNWMGVLLALAGFNTAAAWVFPASAFLSIVALRLAEAPVQPPKILGVHSTFPGFVRVAYGWLLIATAIGVAAPYLDRAGGFRGGSRHALTVGFFSTMVLAIGQRVLPAFSGMRLLFSPRLMFASLVFLTAGCALRVSSEIVAYEQYASFAWHILPVSACLELTAMTLFAVNLLLTFCSQPPHERTLAAA
jgi:uncharacterized protein involved in response to NO